MNPIQFYVDHHVHSAIIKGLRGRGVDCLTAADDERSALADELLFQRAQELGRTMVSLDIDLWNIACEWVRTGRQFNGLVFGRQLRLTIGMAIDDLELIAKDMTPDEMRNQILHLPL